MSPVVWLSNVANAVPASYGLGSIVETQAFLGSPARFFTKLVQVLPPSRVSCTLPSSVPTQIWFGSLGDSATVKIVVWFSALELSIDRPPDWRCFCLAGSLVVRSGEIFTQDSPWSRLRNRNWPPR